MQLAQYNIKSDHSTTLSQRRIQSIQVDNGSNQWIHLRNGFIFIPPYCNGFRHTFDSFVGTIDVAPEAPVGNAQAQAINGETYSITIWDTPIAESPGIITNSISTFFSTVHLPFPAGAVVPTAWSLEQLILNNNSTNPSQPIKGLLLKAFENNTQNIYLGGPLNAIAITLSFRLKAAQSISIMISDLNRVFASCDVIGEGVDLAILQ